MAVFIGALPHIPHAPIFPLSDALSIAVRLCWHRPKKRKKKTKKKLCVQVTTTLAPRFEVGGRAGGFDHLLRISVPSREPCVGTRETPRLSHIGVHIFGS